VEEADEVDKWNIAVKERALELIGDIESDKATGSEVLTAIKWLAQRGAEGARDIIVDVVSSLGSDAVKAYLRSHGISVP
jgi:hypothetical protein